VTTPPTVRDLQKQLSDLIARIPPHLLLPHPLDGTAPPHIHKQIADAKAKATPEAAAKTVATFPIAWPAGFGPYEWFGVPQYGRAADGRPCWIFTILASYYNDKSTFMIWEVQFFSPSEIYTQPYPYIVHHGAAGVGDGGNWLAGFGEHGGYFQGVAGWSPAFGDEHTLQAQSLPQTIAALNEQIAALTKRVAELEAAG